MYISLFLNNAKAYHIFAKQLPLIYGLFTAIQFQNPLAVLSWRFKALLKLDTLLLLTTYLLYLQIYDTRMNLLIILWPLTFDFKQLSIIVKIDTH